VVLSPFVNGNARLTPHGVVLEQLIEVRRLRSSQRPAQRAVCFGPDLARVCAVQGVAAEIVHVLTLRWAAVEAAGGVLHTWNRFYSRCAFIDPTR
jgi:hypothetical protein